MACEYICDGCGKRAPGAFWPGGEPGFHKPNPWFERQDNDGIQVVCSRECIDLVAAKTGKTGVILPF